MKALTRASAVQLLAVLGFAVATAATTAAQSLGDLAKKEEARRQSIKTKGKVITNDSLRGSPASVSVPAPAPPPAAGAPPTAASAPDKPKPEDDRKAQEAQWRTRMQGARDALQRSQMFAEALQSRINGLTADFTARDDPAQRAVVATKAIADMQEEARKAGVPPGWLR
jgi:hypothetical protein